MKGRLLELSNCQSLYVEVYEIYNPTCPASPVYYLFNAIQVTRINTLCCQTRESENPAGIDIRGLRCPARSSEVGSLLEQRQPDRNSFRLRRRQALRETFFDYHCEHQVTIKVVRIFNTYGPRVHPQDGGVIANFIMQALHGEDITMLAMVSRPARSAISTA